KNRGPEEPTTRIRVPSLDTRTSAASVGTLAFAVERWVVVEILSRRPSTACRTKSDVLSSEMSMAVGWGEFVLIAGSENVFVLKLLVSSTAICPADVIVP